MSIISWTLGLADQHFTRVKQNILNLSMNQESGRGIVMLLKIFLCGDPCCPPDVRNWKGNNSLLHTVTPTCWKIRLFQTSSVTHLETKDLNLHTPGTNWFPDDFRENGREWAPANPRVYRHLSSQHTVSSGPWPLKIQVVSCQSYHARRPEEISLPYLSSGDTYLWKLHSISPVLEKSIWANNDSPFG